MIIQRRKRVLTVVRDKVAEGFSFADLAFVVAETLDATDAHATKVSARIKHFQRLGLPARRPGQGAKTPYNLEELAEVVLALQFVEAGLSPSVAVELLRSNQRQKLLLALQQQFWLAVEGRMGGIQAKDKAIHISFEPSFATREWSERKCHDFPVRIGPLADLLRSVGFERFGRMTIISIGFVAYAILCGMIRRLGLEEGYGIDP